MNTKYLRKKLCAIGLSVAAVFGGVAVPVAVNMTQTEVAEAATTNDVVSWMNSKKGKNWYLGGNQCVALFNLYLKECFGIQNPIQATGSVNYAYELANKNIPGFTKVTNGSYKVGDIVVFKQWGNTTRSAGHVAIVYAVNGNNVSVIEQNYDGDLTAQVRQLTDRRKADVSAVFRAPLSDTNPPATNTYWPITDGYYTIKTAVGAYFLDVQGAGTADYANINIWDAFGAHSGQIFKVARNGAGTGYYIQNLNSGRFVDGIVYNKNAKNGDNVVQ